MQKAREAVEGQRLQEAYRHALSAQQLERKGKVQYADGELSPTAFIEMLNGMEEQALAATGNVDAKKLQAQRLLQEAEQALAAGNFKEAYAKVDAADNLNAAFDLLEKRPGSVRLAIAEAETAQAPTFAQTGQYKRSTNNPFPTSNGTQAGRFETTQEPESPRAEAMSLINQARKDLAAGDLKAAREKALQAEKMPVAYGLLDDRPHLVLADIARQERVSNIASNAKEDVFEKEPKNPFADSEVNPFAQQAAAAPKPDQSADKRQAPKLLHQARLDLRA